MTLEERADEIATKANDCCNRSDGYEEDVKALALSHLHAIVEECARTARGVTANRHGEMPEDWQTGFDRGGNAAADRVLEIIHPQQPTAAQ